MRQYLLDTSVLAAFLLGRPPAVELAGRWIRQREAATSILVYGEVVEYLRGRADFVERYAGLHDLLRAVYPHLVTAAEAERYADLRRELRPPHGPGLIGDIDTLIAATAIEHDLTVVTTDADFERVAGLRVLRATIRR